MTGSADIRAPGAVTLAIQGMTCSGCARTVERVLRRVSGVDNATVDFDLGLAVVNGAATPVIAAVEGAGYGAAKA
ncbi:heavy metal-associated domain-containing protein [Bradyrhizobium sp. ISRA443]|uniref:heavy-metal-associated domain-containing protein n=1 Tax=unclassified Bradyrhizobium TaxID=2631580 RepID=UPI0032AF1EF9